MAQLWNLFADYTDLVSFGHLSFRCARRQNASWICVHFEAYPEEAT
jgi:hypothetical protein